MIDLDNIVTLDIDLTAKPYTPEVQVVIDWSKEDVLKAAEHNEKDRIFTIPFYTGSVEDVPDWSDFFEHGYHHLMQPWYVGNVEDVDEAIREVLDGVFGERKNILEDNL